MGALLLPVTTAWVVHFADPSDPSSSVNAIFLSFGLAMLLLGVSSFGQEFSHGTFSNLMAQPVPRRRIWWTKVGVLFAAMVSAFLVMCLFGLTLPYAIEWHDHLGDALAFTGLFTLAAFSGGLWTSLLFRQVTASFWITLLVPTLITFLVSYAAPDNREAPALLWVWCGGMFAYSVAGYFVAWRLFLHAQDAQWTGGTVTIPFWRMVPAAFWPRPSTARHSPSRASILKELHLQHINLLACAGLVVLHITYIGLRKLTGDDPTQPGSKRLELLSTAIWLLWFTIPLLAGAVSIAEERKLGTLDGQLCLPSSRRRQFGIKFLIVMFLGIFLVPSCLSRSNNLET